jgi:hypothetical protein
VINVAKRARQAVEQHPQRLPVVVNGGGGYRGGRRPDGELEFGDGPDASDGAVKPRRVDRQRPGRVFRRIDEPKLDR